MGPKIPKTIGGGVWEGIGMRVVIPTTKIPLTSDPKNFEPPKERTEEREDVVGSSSTVSDRVCTGKGVCSTAIFDF